MSRRDPAHRASRRRRSYLRRFFTSWVATDPDPRYSALDRRDGLGQVPDPVTTPRRPLPESREVAEQASEHEPEPKRSGIAGRSGR